METLAASWAQSGAMGLTGRADGPPLAPPAELVELLVRLGERLNVDALGLLGERAATADLHRRGSISCGGGTRLLPTADGWLALTLARDDDVAVLPAWLETDARLPADVWPAVTRLIAARPSAELDDRAALLGLPSAALGRFRRDDLGGTAFGLPVLASQHGGRAPRSVADALVIDLSSLWAGPLAAQLLADAGARVVKVESTGRPDGARQGPAAFYDLLNGQKLSAALDFADPGDLARLRGLLQAADVVIEGSRPRALEHLGISARELLETPDGPSVWVSITGYGRRPGWRDRVAFGDVAAVAGGLVAHDDDGPCFVADAVADPLAGLVAAAAALDALAVGGRWLVDVAMAGVAAHATGTPIDLGGVGRPAPPRARAPRQPGRPLGADTHAVLAAVSP